MGDVQGGCTRRRGEAGTPTCGQTGSSARRSTDFVGTTFCWSAMSFFSISLFVGASLGAGAGNLAAGTHRFELLFALTTVAAVGYAAATTVARSRYVLRE